MCFRVCHPCDLSESRFWEILYRSLITAVVMCIQTFLVHWYKSEGCSWIARTSAIWGPLNCTKYSWDHSRRRWRQWNKAMLLSVLDYWWSTCSIISYMVDGVLQSKIGFHTSGTIIQVWTKNARHQRQADFVQNCAFKGKPFYKKPHVQVDILCIYSYPACSCKDRDILFCCLILFGFLCDSTRCHFNMHRWLTPQNLIILHDTHHDVRSNTISWLYECISYWCAFGLSNSDLCSCFWSLLSITVEQTIVQPY